MLPPTAMPDGSEFSKMGAADPRSTDAFQIELILGRARQIHRQHGGLFGYDFDDWAQAWSEPSETARTKLELQQARENGTELVPQIKTEVLEPCFGFDN